MICFPNCKINLGLYITRKRDDSYHDLETVFYPLTTPGELRSFTSTHPKGEVRSSNIPLNDVLEIVPANGAAQLHISGLPVTGNIDDNLVWKAYKLLQASYPNNVPPLDIYLHKALPMGAGMGGGSADGAFMLRLVNDYCCLGLSNEQLAGYALQLGSDCPFFIYNSPQYATGRGEVMHPVSVDLSGYSIQLICPEVHVSTRDAFANISPRPAPFGLQGISNIPVAEWKHHISNDFEQTVFGKYHALANIKQQLYEQGAVYASMSGSGAAIYGIFAKGKKATILADVPFKEYFV